MPQALTKFGSVIFAKPGTSETRFLCSYFCAVEIPLSATMVMRPTAQRPTRWHKYPCRDMEGLLGETVFMNRVRTIPGGRKASYGWVFKIPGPATRNGTKQITRPR